jgi:hypothetical protein
MESIGVLDVTGAPSVDDLTEQTRFGTCWSLVAAKLEVWTASLSWRR